MSLHGLTLPFRRGLNATSLKARVLLLVVGLLVVGIWGLAAQVSQTLKHDLQSTLSDQLMRMVGYVADDFDEGLRLRLSLLSGLAETLTADHVQRPEAAQSALDRRGISSLIFPSGVFVADRSGTIIAGGGATIPERIGRNIADREYFRDTLATAKPVISRPLMGRVTHAATVVIAVPIRDVDGSVAGVLAASIELMSDGMFGEIEKLKFGNDGYSILFSPKDRLIVAATDRSRILHDVPPPGKVPLLDRRINEGFEGAGITINSSGQEVLTASRNMKSTGWILLAAIPTEEAFAPIATLKRHVYLAALVITLSVAGLLWFALTRQLGPLQAAGAAMQRMSDGVDPFKPLSIRRPDEIGRLIKHFNRLVHERQRTEAELAQHRDHLQDLVREQTADVLQAKEAAEKAHAVKSQFLAKMSHELRTPLQTIQSYSRLGQDLTDRPRPQQLAAYFKKIEAAGRDLLQMINDLLDLSKLEAGMMTLERTVEDLGEIARSVARDMEPLLRDKALRFDIDTGAHALLASVDGRRFAQVLRNLYSNAIKFSPPGGCIRVSFSALAATGSNDADGICVAVADQGGGIAETELADVFEKFSQSSQAAASGGIGLGLAIAKEIVEAHGGSIRAYNGSTGGAIFAIEMPRTRRSDGVTRISRTVSV